MDQVPYQPKNKIRIVTAASLFDGHDAAINIMRRIIQSTGCEVIHLGHDRSVEEVVNCAIQEDVQAIAMTSYQGGHNEYFKFMYDLLLEKGANQIKIFGGGGGTILPEEIKVLEDYGIAKIYHPDDGRKMGLQGMINDLVKKCDFPTGNKNLKNLKNLTHEKHLQIGNFISSAENYGDQNIDILNKIKITAVKNNIPVLGITGTGGAGKSSLVDELVRRFLLDFQDKNLAIVSVDPSKRKTGGALLGDRIRMNSINNNRVYMRSLATRQSNLALSKHVAQAVDILKFSNFDLIILETSGIGQSDTEILDHSDVSLYVMTPEFGAATQLEKIDMLDFADVVALNKFDKRGSLDAIRDVKKQYRRNHNLWEAKDEDIPVYGTIASQFNDPGMNVLYQHLMDLVNNYSTHNFKSSFLSEKELSEKIFIIPPNRIRYLSEISENNRLFDKNINNQVEIADRLYALNKALVEFKDDAKVKSELENKIKAIALDFEPRNQKIINEWEELCNSYSKDFFIFNVRGKEIKIATSSNSLSHSKIPKVVLPKFTSWGDMVRWSNQENVPGKFPFTAGLFPFKREGEDPTRMFAGEGGPERTNKRFHYLSYQMPAKRLSTAFDSVTLYGNDPGLRPDIYGKIGNAGVSICCLDDAKKLYSGFDLSSPNTSVSMTIN